MARHIKLQGACEFVSGLEGKRYLTSRTKQRLTKLNVLAAYSAQTTQGLFLILLAYIYTYRRHLKLTPLHIDSSSYCPSNWSLNLDSEFGYTLCSKKSREPLKKHGLRKNNPQPVGLAGSPKHLFRRVAKMTQSRDEERNSTRRDKKTLARRVQSRRLLEQEPDSMNIIRAAYLTTVVRRSLS